MANPQKLIAALLRPAPDTPAPRPAQRRVRVLFNRVYVVDTLRALFVWEHPYYPQYYFPRDELERRPGVTVTEGEEVREADGGARRLRVEVRPGGKGKGEGRTFEALALGEGKWAGTTSELTGMVRVENTDMDAWFEEDTQIYGHPKDPTKRIFLLPTSRPLKIKIGPHTIVDTAATATSYVHLIEPMLPVRYYLPPTAIDQSILRHSKTTSYCPYKGMANYYDVVLEENGKEVVYKDLVWYYKSPLPECAGVLGMVCVWPEKAEGLELHLDGERIK